MGGSGGNSSFGGLGFNDRKEILCESLRFKTAVVSPLLNVLKNLTPGDKLKVVLDNDQTRPVVNVVTSSGWILGSLLPSNIGRLVQCLANGTNYEAKIVEVSIPKCMVDVYPV